MNITTYLNRLVFVAAMLALVSLPAFAQDASTPQKDDVIRIHTDLVQTAVTVTDKKGQFVDGLKPDEFDLKIDGVRQPIRFLEHVVAGSAAEELLAAPNVQEVAAGTPRGGYRGRTIVFFVDDLHLSLQSLERTRQTVIHFLETEMTNQDMVAIVSASGQIGFLQQFTNNKEVLRAALNRLNVRPYTVRGYGIGSAQMSEYMAYVIDSRSDPKLTEVYIEECMKQTSVPKKIRSAVAAIRMTCETQVKSSARAILLQSAAITQDTYHSLESLMRSSARMPGRKLAFFISDGFLLDAGARGPDLVSKLQQITDAAQRSGVVVYTIDAKGLVSTGIDATNNRVMDPNGRLESALLREIAVTQDALHALAGDTGGRALRNQNGFERWVSKILDETSNYYLLGWRPDTDEQKDKKFRRVEVSISGRPDLTVRLPRGYIEGAKVSAKQIAAISATESLPITAQKKPDLDLRDALGDAHTRHSLPTLLALSYLNTPTNGMVMTSSMQIASRLLDYGADRKQSAAVDLAGVVLNDKGKVVTSFKQRLTVDPLTSDAASDVSGLIYNHRAPLAPGIYQVRVAARDEKSGRVGSAMDWIVVPNLESHHLTTSSLLVGGQLVEKAKSTSSAAKSEPQVQWSVDRRFSRTSSVGFWLFIYNAMRDTKGNPNLTVQVQVLRDGQTLVATPKRKLATEGMSDLARIPYGGDVALKSLNAGRYELRVIVTDLLATAATTLSTDFQVE